MDVGNLKKERIEPSFFVKGGMGLGIEQLKKRREGKGVIDI